MWRLESEHRHQEPALVRTYRCSLNANSVFLEVLGKGENVTSCKRLTRQVCVLVKCLSHTRHSAPSRTEPRAGQESSAVTVLCVLPALVILLKTCSLGYRSKTASPWLLKFSLKHFHKKKELGLICSLKYLIRTSKGVWREEGLLDRISVAIYLTRLQL